MLFIYFFRIYYLYLYDWFVYNQLHITKSFLFTLSILFSKLPNSWLDWLLDYNSKYFISNNTVDLFKKA